MVSLTLSKKESVVFITAFIFSFYILPHIFVLVWTILFLAFIAKRTELYFLWSIIAPRITGSAPILEHLLALAREEGPGNGQLNDLLELNIPLAPRMFFVFKDTHVRRILTTEADWFPTTGSEGVMVKITGGSSNNILLSPGPPNPHWARYREASSPINRDRSGPASTLAQMIDIAWKSMQDLTVSHFSNKCGTDVLLFKELFEVMIPSHNRALFGEEFARKYTYNELSSEIYDIISETGKQLKFNFCPPWIKGPYMAKIKRVTDAVGYMMRDSTSSFMKPLLDAQRAGKMTTEELLSNVMVFEFAQAPLHVVFWVLYLLGMHVEEEKRVVAEIAEVLARGPVTYERLPEFKYLSKVIMETLRLYPGVGLLQVRTARHDTVFGQHYVPSGSLIFLCAYMNHRNATYWPNPDEFIPTREGIDPARYGENLAYIPFGNGPRQCQGQYFALDFVKLSLVSILQHFSVSIAPNQKKPVPTEIGFLRPVYPLTVRFATRVLPVPQAVPQSIAGNDSLSYGQLLSSGELSPLTGLSPRGGGASSSSLLDERASLTSSAGFPSTRSGMDPRTQATNEPTKWHQEPVLDTTPTPISRTLAKKSGSKKMDALIYQSQIFKGSLTSIGPLSTTRDLLVLYGTQTGTSRSFAVRLVQMAKLCKIAATCASLSKIDITAIPKYKTVVVVTSTYGDGGPPENAEKFSHRLETETSKELFSQVPYAVLALGSSMYPFPFKFGTFVSKQFERLGARRLIPDQRIDEIRYNQQQEFTNWSVKLFEAISANADRDQDIIAHNKMLGFHDFDFNLLHAPFKLTFTTNELKMEPCSFYRGDALMATVVSNTLVNADPTNLIYSMETRLSGALHKFQAGDTVGVIPNNPRDTVNKLISRTGYDPTQVFYVEAGDTHVEVGDTNIVELSCSLGHNKCTLEIALTYFFDITSAPSVGLLKFLGMHSRDPRDQKKLTSYAAKYPSFLRLQYSVLDIFEGMPSIKLTTDDEQKNAHTLSIFLGLLGPIKQRHYSVANFPEASPNILRIVYKVVDYAGKDGRPRKGLCTNYLKERIAGETVIVYFSKTKFRLPDDLQSPVIMLSTGAGISPYLGFLEQRLYQKGRGEKLGQGILIHGCRTENDFAFKGKINEALEAGALDEIYPAYSRPSDSKPVHVQDVLQDHGSKIWNMMSKENAIMYVCGDVSVGTSVREVLVRVAKEHGKLSIFLAHAWVRRLAENKRLRTDDWGIATTDGAQSILSARLRLWRRSVLAAFAFHANHARRISNA